MRVRSTGERGRVNDRSLALRKHHLELVMEREEHARQADAHDAIPVLERALHQWHRLARNPGVVERDVEPAVTLSDAADQGGDVVFPADIACTNSAFPPPCWICATRACPPASSRSAPTTSAPWRANSSAAALPMPDAAPPPSRRGQRISSRSTCAAPVVCPGFLSLSPGRWESVVRARDRAHPRDDQGGRLSLPTLCSQTLAARPGRRRSPPGHIHLHG